MMSKAFEFISTDPSVTLKPGKCKAIRSHCMQGKNRREGSRRSKREKDRNTLIQINRNSTATLIAPSRTELAHMRFAGQVEPEVRALLAKAYAYNMASKSFSPLIRCVDFDHVESEDLQRLFSDAAFLHSILCASYAASDMKVPTWSGEPGRRVVVHTSQALTILARKMDDENTAKSEPVLYAVINLAVLSAVYGDWNAAGAHFYGLHQIVQLRGGMAFLHTQPKLHAKIDRLDLARSLSLGTPLLFAHPTVSWDALVKRQAMPQDFYHPPTIWDVRLATIFLDFQHLALKINAHMKNYLRHNADCFQPLLSTLQSRLMYLTGELESQTEELVRLTLLAYLTTSFELSVRGMEYPWLSDQFEAFFMNNAELLRGDAVLRAWVMMIASISVGKGRAWVKKKWGDEREMTKWSDVKDVLVSVMWIEYIHDQAGKDALRWLTGA